MHNNECQQKVIQPVLLERVEPMSEENVSTTKVLSIKSYMRVN